MVSGLFRGYMPIRSLTGRACLLQPAQDDGGHGGDRLSQVLQERLILGVGADDEQLRDHLRRVGLVVLRRVQGEGSVVQTQLAVDVVPLVLAAELPGQVGHLRVAVAVPMQVADQVECRSRALHDLSDQLLGRNVRKVLQFVAGSADALAVGELVVEVGDVGHVVEDLVDPLIAECSQSLQSRDGRGAAQFADVRHDVSP